MALSDFLQPNCVKVPLESTEKQAAIFELVDLLAENHDCSDAQTLKDAVWQREETRTTGIGCGLGIPHGKCSVITELKAVIGKPAQPIEYDAIDGQPVDIIVLLVSPPNMTIEHVQALGRISRMMGDPDFRGKVRKIENSDELYQLLTQQDLAVNASNG